MKICKNCTEFMCSNSGVNTYSAHCKGDDKLNIYIISPDREMAKALLKNLTKNEYNSGKVLKDGICIDCGDKVYFWIRDLENLKGKRAHILYIDTIYSIEDYSTKIIPLTLNTLNHEIHFFKRKDRINIEY